MAPGAKNASAGRADAFQEMSSDQHDPPTIAHNCAGTQARNSAQVARRVRLQYLARRLHGLGEKPLFYFLDEVERGAPLRPHLLPSQFIKANGCDELQPLLLIDGWRR